MSGTGFGRHAQIVIAVVALHVAGLYALQSGLLRRAVEVMVPKRLGEQGEVMVRVFIGVDGTASQAQIRTSSGFDRLDQMSLQTVLSWKYLPGKVNGEPKAMWFKVPINFVLE